MDSIKLVTLFVLAAIVICVINATLNHSALLNIFPENIPIFNVRKDKFSHQEVSRGRLNELG